MAPLVQKLWRKKTFFLWLSELPTREIVVVCTTIHCKTQFTKFQKIRRARLLQYFDMKYQRKKYEPQEATSQIISLTFNLCLHDPN